MNPKELRIGNLIKVGEETVQVTELFLDDTGDMIVAFAPEVYGTNYASVKDVEPLRITHDIMLERGFHFEGGYYYQAPFVFYRRGRFYGLNNVPPSFKEIEHVHQLQNVCYAFKNVEL